MIVWTPNEDRSSYSTVQERGGQTYVLQVWRAARNRWRYLIAHGDAQPVEWGPINGEWCFEAAMSSVVRKFLALWVEAG